MNAPAAATINWALSPLHYERNMRRPFRQRYDPSSVG
ncbi:hypothetical protein AVEN_108735-1, partial [Araneus ventricosus]